MQQRLGGGILVLPLFVFILCQKHYRMGGRHRHWLYVFSRDWTFPWRDSVIFSRRRVAVEMGMVRASRRHKSKGRTGCPYLWEPISTFFKSKQPCPCRAERKGVLVPCLSAQPGLGGKNRGRGRERACGCRAESAACRPGRLFNRRGQAKVRKNPSVRTESTLRFPTTTAVERTPPLPLIGNEGCFHVHTMLSVIRGRLSLNRPHRAQPPFS